mmetsp:Transcript_23587/g.56536  ORF Transcript_23587/g.56536 Transcript_23587/m.56536 type:complete len:90 (+) Transcript_23587:3-272(+)
MGWGWGWVFNVTFFSVLGAYFGIGMAYKVKHKGHSVGVEALPNIEFWRSLPLYVRDGLFFSREVVMGRLKDYKESRQGTEQVPGYNEMS